MCITELKQYMTKQKLLIIAISLILTFSLKAQTFTETGQSYPVSIDKNKYAVSGFVPFEKLKDEEIYANSLLWIIENICPKERDGITKVDIPARNFSCDLVLASLPGSTQDNTYYCQAVFRVADGKLIYYISDVLIESSIFVMRKVTPLEKLTPEKKASHKQTMEDFIDTESMMLNKLFDFISTNQLSLITHWNEISIRKPVKGMTEDECRLAFGKPQAILETNGEIQWMYNSSFYLFFKEGSVQTIIK